MAESEAASGGEMTADAGDDREMEVPRRAKADRFAKLTAVATIVLFAAAGWATMSVNAFTQSIVTDRPGQKSHTQETPSDRRRPGPTSGDLEPRDFVGKWVITNAPDAWGAEGAEFELVSDGDLIVVPSSAEGDFSLELRAKVPGQMEGDIRATGMSIPVTAWLASDKSVLTIILTPPVGPPLKAEAARRGATAR